MKKLTVLLMLICAFCVTTFAQTETKDKVKKTSTFGQKVHNTFSKHKRYNGYKVKRKKEVNGHTVREKKKIVYDKH